MLQKYFIFEGLKDFLLLVARNLVRYVNKSADNAKIVYDIIQLSNFV